MKTDVLGSNTPADIRDLWQTPPAVFNFYNMVFGFKIDGAAADNNKLLPDYWTAEDNALAQNWDQVAGPIWINPPYSNILPWVQKAAESSATVCMLVPANTDTKFFELAAKSCSRIDFITGGRLSFIRADTQKAINGNTRGSMVMMWNCHNTGAKFKTIPKSLIMAANDNGHPAI